MKKTFAIAAASVAALSLGAAQAAIVDLTDRTKATSFNSVVIAGQNGGAPINLYNGVPEPQANNPLYINIGPGSLVVKITGSPTMTNGSEAGRKDCAATTGLTCDTDGLGILNDEISQRNGNVQTVTVEFLSEDDGSVVAVNVRDLAFLDLFFKAGETPDPSTNQESAIATFSNAGGLISSFSTVGNTPLSNALGYETAVAQGFAGALGVTSIVFFAGAGMDNKDGDFALAAITIDDIPGITTPIPGAIPLFLAGLGGLAAARSRRS